MKTRHIKAVFGADRRLRVAIQQLAAERRDAPVERVETVKVRLHVWDQLLEAKKGKSQ